MQLSPAPHAAAATTHSNSRPESAEYGRSTRRGRARSYLLQGYAARRRPARFRVR
ncbi:MAG: hypothetical protein GX538_02655 [Gammaproteobacteria bacterium]|nr:hypothetical protein [Gammaproteobacteria bacterium]